jgi:UDPglucose 6-dehydrogenase
MPERSPIGVIGVGWVGLVSATCFAELGHDVWCRDIDADKVAALSRGDVPIYEPGLQDLVTRNLERLHFVTDMGPVLEQAKLMFVCVDTPPTYSGDADLSRVEAVVEELPDSTEHAIVMKSTVPVGTGANVERRLAELGKGGLGYASNPEFLKEGSAVDDFMNPDRVVVGSAPRSPWVGDVVAALYEPLGCPVVRTDVASSEMIKLASNAFLATKISFINEIANVCEEVGADVSEVAAGMGLDPRIGQSFLNAGIGYGGSCLAGEETVLTRTAGNVRLVSLQSLFQKLESQAIVDSTGAGLASPRGLEVLSWREGADAPEFLPVTAVTRRPFEGDLVELRTKMGRRLRSTPDHPFLVAQAGGGTLQVKTAEELTEEDWIPIAQNAPGEAAEAERLDALAAVTAAGIESREVIVRPAEAEISKVAARPAAERNVALAHPRGSRIRLYDVARRGALRLDELRTLGLSLEGATMGTARNGTYVPASIVADEAFWRMVGLYIAEGHCNVDGRRHRLQWSFHPTDEEDLVEEVAGFWGRLGVKASIFRRPTTTAVVVSSRLLATWWLDALGLGRNCYEQRIPDLAWKQPESYKRALLAGLWRGDGSWSYVAHGPSVVLEYGTASHELIDGILRLLGDLGVVARSKVGRTARSTRDNYWLVVSSADQVERLLDLVPEQDREAIRTSLALQAKRIAPTGYRRHSVNAAWVRVTEKLRHPFQGFVYSLEVPETETFVTTGGLVVHNCFPKDVSALKQLAGNSGYHFQLLTAVIEVNELQKRRVVSKLKRHLHSLAGKRIALLGLAFKPNTDDMREASSVVLAARLQAEGALVRAYDPVAEESASELLTGVDMCDSALDAINDADAAVIVTEWPEFGELDLAEVKSRMANPVIVDGRNMLSAEHARAAGLVYEGIGRV